MALTPGKLSSLDLENFQGRRLHTQLFDLISRPGGNTARYAIIVTKKTAPNAVDRNRMKRRLRPLITKALAALPSPIDVLLIAKAKLEKVTSKELEAALSAAIRQLA